MLNTSSGAVAYTNTICWLRRGFPEKVAKASQKAGQHALAGLGGTAPQGKRPISNGSFGAKRSWACPKWDAREIFPVERGDRSRPLRVKVVARYGHRGMGQLPQGGCPTRRRAFAQRKVAPAALFRPEVLGQFDAVGAARLLQNVVHVHLHRARGQRQGARDVLVVLAYEQKA